mgnify:CR=1 FL=1
MSDAESSQAAENSSNQGSASKTTRLPGRYWKLWSANFISNLGNGVSAVAMPWLASALTRSPLTIAIIGLMSQLPWLLFTLPAGVITDRFDRKKIIILTDLLRGVVTVIASVVLYINRTSFTHIKNPSEAFIGGSSLGLLLMIGASSFLLGAAEVLGNNAAQTFMPDVVEQEILEKANGQMWSAEYLTVAFIGPFLGSLLLGLSIYLPFFFDATSFFFFAGLIALIATQARKMATSAERRAKASESNRSSRQQFSAELREGFTWLMSHKVLRPLAFTLGSLNLTTNLAFASFILYVQEVLHVSVFIFAVLGTAGAIGGMLGGWLGPKIIAKLGDGRTLTLALIGYPTFFLLAFFVRNWYFFYAIAFLESLLSVLWNIVTVSFRQSVIPNELLGRVNSGYRFFGWGSMPLGSFLGGAIVTVSAHFVSRSLALRIPFLVSALLGLIVFAVTRSLFTSERLNEVRIAAGVAPRP